YDPYFWGVTLLPKTKSDKENIKEIEIKKQNAFLQLNRIRDNKFYSKPFEIKEDATITVEAVGEGRSGRMFDYGWIEDVDNDMVWEMTYHKTQHAGGASKNRMVRETIELKKGFYNLCYQSDDSHSYRDWNDDRPYNPKSWGIALYAREDEKVNMVDENSFNKESKWNYKLIRIGDDEHKFRAFSIDELSKISVYAIGEGDDDDMFDYAWIENKNNGKVVWEMLYRNTKWAGGAKKNRKITSEIYLPAGKYLLHYESDGSHSFEDWNDDKPRDSRNYGVSIKIEPAK
ncbi:MAG: hypothetical protein KAR38_03230, partial [Calditrichia bacterium]|nr:hypothetical protein [Calditrichia bacterium]